MDAVGAGLFEKLLGPAVEDDGRRARCGAYYFYFLPTHAVRPAGAQGFERGFFCGEACGIMLRADNGAAPRAVIPFLRGEHALGEALGACERGADAPHFDDVNANGNDHGRNLD